MSGFIHTGSCPVCGGKRDKTGCRESRDGAYWCRTTFKSDRGRHKKGEVVNGYRFMHETEASGAYHIWRDPQDRGQKPRDRGRSGPRVVVSEWDTPQDVPMDWAAKDALLTTDWNAIFKSALTANGSTSNLPGLSASLGVPMDALRAVGCCWVSKADAFDYARNYNLLAGGWKPCFVFPLRDGTGNVVGFSRRYQDGTKRTTARREADPSADGLFYADDWATHGPGPVLVVEGASDTAALHGAGQRAVGRPSNLGGVKHLVDLLRPLPAGTEVCVMGENDAKPDSLLWPGRDGAQTVAQRLCEALPHLTVFWGLPSTGAKDARSWLDGRTGLESGNNFVSQSKAAGWTYCAPPVSGYGTRNKDTDGGRVPYPGQDAPPQTIFGCLGEDALHHHDPSLCQQARSELWVSRSDNPDALGMVIRCGNWRCTTCRTIMAADWVARLADSLQTTLDNGFEAYHMFVAPGERNAVFTRFRKLKARRGIQGEYVQLGWSDGRTSFLFLLPKGTDVGKTRLAGATPMNVEAIADLLSKWKADMQHNGPHGGDDPNRILRPIAVSAAYHRSRQYRSRKWEKYGGSTARKEETFRKLLAENGFHYAEHVWTQGGPPVIWALYIRCLAKDRLRLRDLWAQAEDPRPEPYYYPEPEPAPEVVDPDEVYERAERAAILADCAGEVWEEYIPL
jgi:hypothetical protein